jgi:hypothetical protein
MDPASFSLLVKALEPALGLLALAVGPIGIVWILKHHKLRMRELDIEERMLPKSAETRLAAIEARLGAIEQAVGAPPQRSLEERAALLEGPGTEAEREATPLAPTRER